MKRNLLLGAATILGALAAQATIYSTNWNSGFANGGMVPDNNLSGWSDTRTVNTMPAGTLTAVAVDLNLSGGWNGDLYAYLVHDSGFTVLLDQIGSGPYGDNHAGMTVTLVDNGTAFGGTLGNIGTYAGVGNPSGQWNPDNTSGSLSSFLSSNPNGTWSLFIADKSGGGVSTVQSWGLQMDIVAVPEVESWIAAALAGAFGAFWVNRQIWGRKPA
jgi:subtilisin-like proprotein convertase family protein